MNWSIIMMDGDGGFPRIFTAVAIIPTIKDPVSGIHNYLPEIREEYFKTHPRIETAPLSKRTILIKSLGILIFAIVLTGGALLAGADSFGDGFLFAVVLMATVGAYNTFFIDWVLFAKLKMFRLPSAEHMDKEYAQKWFHVKGMLFSDSLFALIVGLVVGGAVTVIR